MQSQDVGMAAGGLVVLALFAFIGLALFVFWIWMLIHAATNPGIEGTEKVAWVLVVFFASFLGSIIYFFVGRPKARLAGRT
jgi:hypothetical protein